MLITIGAKGDNMQPNPGSPEALDRGCTCPIVDNHGGNGFGDPLLFWITDGCPLHDGRVANAPH